MFSCIIFRDRNDELSVYYKFSRQNVEYEPIYIEIFRFY